MIDHGEGSSRDARGQAPSLARSGAQGEAARWVFPPGTTRFVRGAGSWLFDAEGRAFLDASAADCPLGHGHPALVAALERLLDERPPGVMHVGPQAHAGRLARALAERAGGRLSVSLFATSGAEAVEAAIKLARAATGRAPLVRFAGARHGATLGALSLSEHEASLEPLLPECHVLPRGSMSAVEQAIERHRPAALIVDPLHVAAGVFPDERASLVRVRALCGERGTLFVVDETRCGLGRAGGLFAFRALGLEGSLSPDVVVLGGALGGGLAPIGVALVSAEAHARAFGGIDRFDLHGSTFAASALSCAAGLATLEAIEAASLPLSAARLGARLLEGLRAAAPGGRAAIRGAGLLAAVEPLGGGEGGGRAAALRLLADGIFARPTADGRAVLLEPPLTATDGEIDRLSSAVGSALWSTDGAGGEER